ncbi:F-box only protein 30-like [Ornithodoros turicata]|uniref:F-box only protein 30-like n=1 Tax=Ornithodoros turicata TaxID=34597 RepID=UPI003139E750
MGMEQRGLADDGDIHKHCMTCIKVLKCSTRPQKDRGCRIVSCEFDCGARFHMCKLKEHLVLCSNVKVPCINYVSGCPVWLLRGQMGKHLRHCPASVVHCTMEWNRWPSQAPSPCGSASQLDVALALRDQRALNLAQLTSQNGTETAHQPSTNGHVRNTSEDGCITMDVFSFDNYDTPWETKKVPPGLQRSVCSELYRASRHATESLAAAITVITGHAPSRNGCYTVNGAGSSDTPSALNGRSCYDPLPSSGTMCHNGSGPEGAIHLNGVKALDSKSLYSIDLKTSGSDSNCGAKGAPAKYSPLKLDLNLECIAWYQSKPESMYTFPCGQVFRRDEYAWHYQNVHSEIHGGLNGWLEQRCPLAQYGCTFSRRRLYPSPPGSVLVHNDIIESFGLQIPSPTCSDLRITNGYGSPEKATTHQQISISQDKATRKHAKTASFNNLPFEVLQHIARFLDGFSLSNFALVSRAMRDICRSLLEERGMVVLHWEKQGGCWKVSHKRWYFSTAFSPIQDWCFSDDSNMSNHLSHCPYFLRNVKVEPFFGLCANARPFEMILKEEIRVPHHISLEAMMLSPIGKPDYERQMTKL